MAIEPPQHRSFAIYNRKEASIPFISRAENVDLLHVLAGSASHDESSAEESRGRTFCYQIFTADPAALPLQPSPSANHHLLTKRYYPDRWKPVGAGSW
jgi:hypothetical protein